MAWRVIQFEPDDLYKFIKKKFGKDYATVLKEQEISGEMFLKLTQDEVKQLYPILGQRKKIESLLAEYRSASADVSDHIDLYNLYLTLLMCTYFHVMVLHWTNLRLRAFGHEDFEISSFEEVVSSHVFPLFAFIHSIKYTAVTDLSPDMLAYWSHTTSVRFGDTWR